MKNILSILPAAFFLFGCTTTQLHDAMTKAEAGAWTIANAYETVNTATGGTLTKNLLNAALKATHNTPDTDLVQTAGKLADAAINAQLTARNSGASNLGQQAAITNVLSDSGVIQSAAAIAPLQLQVPVGAIDGPKQEVCLLKVVHPAIPSKIDIRPIYKWRDAYNLELAKQ